MSLVADRAMSLVADRAMSPAGLPRAAGPGRGAP
jgi:hypothetical protein